jgi:hypothetical protein
MKDNFKKRGRCSFCGSEKTVQHLFFDCHISSGMLSSSVLVVPPHDTIHLFGSGLKSVFSRI